MTTKIERRIKIKTRIRGKISGTAERPRMTVFRSNKQIYVQLVDDLAGKTLAAASSRGMEAAKKNLVKVPVLKGTIPHDQLAKFGGALVYIKPASPGTGVKAGGAMRAVLESVGITDVLAKSKGSSNPHNLVKATISALCELRDAATVAQNRGISVEKVFKG